MSCCTLCTLRSASLQLCERVYFDLPGRLDLCLVPRVEVLAEGEDGTGHHWREAEHRVSAFLESPDRSQDLRAWLVAFVHDLLEIDAVAVYTRRTRGSLYALELVDGTCYSRDMEILTASGWKPFDELDLEHDRFATRIQRTHAFEWQKATYFHEAEWDSDRDGDRYRFTSRGLDLLVTPNHRMLVTSMPRKLGGSRHRERGEVIVSAADLAEHASRFQCIPLASAWGALDVDEVRLPASTPRARDFVCSGDDFAAFMGMYLAEGCAPQPDQVYVSQQTSSKGFVAYQDLFRHLFGRDVCHTGKNFVVGHKTLHDYLRPLGKAYEKTVPDLVMNISARQLRIFWDYYLLGDGHIEKAGRRAKAGRERIWTSSRRLAEQLQEIAQKLGYSAVVAISQPKGDTILSDGRVIRKEHKRVRYAVGLRRSRQASFEVERLPYCGPVYCVSVPNEVIYVRRNGKAAWCGNTIKPLLDLSGRAPRPPAPAYQQFLYGMPAGDYTLD
jgi:replicative DNA helicase Mcm